MISLPAKKKSEEYLKRVALLDKVRHEMFEAYRLILDSDHWCKRALARDKDGEQLFNSNDERAVQFCILGAVYKNPEWSDELLTFMTNYAKSIGIEDLSRFNDQSTHADVLMYFEAMLKLLGVEIIFYDEDGKEMKK